MFFFYLPHCQALINIHEFPASEYLSSWEEGGLAARGQGEGPWWHQAGEMVGSLWVCSLAFRLSFQATAGKMEKAGRQDGVLPASAFILPW